MVGIKLKGSKVMLMRGALMALCLDGGLSACASVTPMPASLAPAGAVAAAQRPYAARPDDNQYAQAPVKGGPRYKLGAPYQAGGVWYVPAEQPGYDEVGIASWYGDQFNGKPTANGEIFDMNAVSAAHATLPMPCIVEVTNLENGRSIQVRMNDRGPFHPGRIIDLSRGAAQQLGYFDKGTAKVRVRFVSAAPLLGADTPTMVASDRMNTYLPPVQAAPSSAKPPVQPNLATAGFTIQAGAFSDRANAERVAARLADAGKAAILPLDHNGARLYRVTVGAWPSAQEAGVAREQVAALGFAEARVVSGS